MAVFNSLIDRWLRVPLSAERSEVEKEKIIEIGRVNGYEEDVILKLMKRKGYWKRVRETTTLCNEREKSEVFTTLPYHPKYFHKFQKVLKKYDLSLAPVNKYNLKNFFHGKLKDKKEPEEMSGVYEMSCKDWEKVYVGQTRRSIATRGKEHMRNVRNAEVGKSAIAKHCVEEGHEMNKERRLLKRVDQRGRMNITEALFMFKKKEELLNDELDGLLNPLFKCLRREEEEEESVETPG